MPVVQKLLMPKLGLTMTEGTVVAWPVAAGAAFAAGETVVVVETDKVANEIEAPEGGTLLRILVPAGETVPVGSTLAEWEVQAAGRSLETSAAANPAAEPAAAAAVSELRQTPGPAQLVVARRMTQAKQQIPHFYLSTEIDVGALQARRAEWNAEGLLPKLSVTHLFVAALGRALKAHPDLNRVWDEDGYLALPGIDVGIAVNTDQGLMVPVLRGVAGLSLEDAARGATDLVARARRGALAPEDVGGGAITLSNAGMFNVTYMGSIINPGQAAILAVGSERRAFRPDADGRPRLTREIGATLSCDHRVLDGVGGLRLLNAVRELLEAPERLFG